MKKSIPLLGGLSVDEFLRDYWQKKPLLIRQAIPGFNGLLSPKKMIELACDDDAQARIVTQNRGKFGLQCAPFTATDFTHFGKATKWTVLLQGLNHYLPEGAELLKQFDFIPHARLDDLMVSYAPKGGGVGPHFDPYDVFLLQGMGHRRWQISTQADRRLVEGAPLRILKAFHVEQEWILEPGDMLYLPPQCGHNGIAEDDCMTYSIGFRTPAYQEMAEQFLVYLQDRIGIEGMYADPNLKTQAHPSEISEDMLGQIVEAIQKIRWDREDVANFLGSYLSEPKPHIFFDGSEQTPDMTTFSKMVAEHGVKLNLKTQMLCHEASSMIFVNGDSFAVSPSSYRSLRALADNRTIPKHAELSNETIALLAEFYQDGWIIFADC